MLKKLKAGKATGVDEIMAEWMKYGGEKMTYALWVLCNHVWLRSVPGAVGARCDVPTV